MPPHVLGASALIIRHDRILLGHRTDRDLWDFPGGVVEPGEAPWQAAAREAFEEVSVEHMSSASSDWPGSPTPLTSSSTSFAPPPAKPAPTHPRPTIRRFPIGTVPENLLEPHAERLARYRLAGWCSAPLLWSPSSRAS